MRPVRGSAFVAAAALAAAILTGAAFASTAQISFVDVGQGDGVVMRIGSKIVVSDAGQFKYENIDAALHSLGAKQVDVAILSHFTNKLSTTYE